MMPKGVDRPGIWMGRQKGMVRKRMRMQRPLPDRMWRSSPMEIGPCWVFSWSVEMRSLKVFVIDVCGLFFELYQIGNYLRIYFRTASFWFSRRVSRIGMNSV